MSDVLHFKTILQKTSDQQVFFCRNLHKRMLRVDDMVLLPTKERIRKRRQVTMATESLLRSCLQPSNEQRQTKQSIVVEKACFAWLRTIIQLMAEVSTKEANVCKIRKDDCTMQCAQK